MTDFDRSPLRKLPSGFSLVPKAVGMRGFSLSSGAAIAPLGIIGLSLVFAVWAARKGASQLTPPVPGTNPATFSTSIGWMDLVVVVIFLAAVVYLATFNQRRVRAFARSVQSKDRCVCPACLYDLRSIDDKLPCPECGDATPREIAKEQWRNWFTMIGFTEHHSNDSSSRRG